MSSSKTYVMAAPLALLWGALASCAEGPGDLEPPPSAAQPATAPPDARIELPTLAARTWFHAIEGSIVGGGALHEIRSQDGEVVFTPGTVDASGAVVAGAPLHLRTLRVGRGDGPPAAPIEQAAVDGELRIEHAHAREVWINDADAAEQSFHFDAVPAGNGDLVVEIATSGLSCEGSTSAGLRFANAEGTSGVLYGHAVFIDAAGTETIVPSVCDDNGITLRVPAGVVDDAAYPAVLDPVVAPSFELNAPVAESTNGEYPNVACSDLVCLLGFTDDRDGTLRRYAGRYTPDGEVLDDVPLMFGGPVTQVGESFVEVGHMQDRFLVVYRVGLNVMGQVVGEDGSPLSAPITIGGSASSSVRSNVGCGPDDCTVTWRVSPSTVMANRVAFDGTVLDGAGIVVSTNALTAYGVEWALGRYFVTYRGPGGNGSVEAKRIENGVILDAAPIIAIPGSGALPDEVGVATNGSDFFVTADDTTTSLRGSFVSNDGGILPPGQAFTIPIPQASAVNGTIWAGSEYSILYRPWSGPSQLRSLRVSATGVPNPTTALVYTGNGGPIDVMPLPSGGGVFVLDGGGNTVVSPMFGGRLDGTGQLVGSAYRIANGVNNQTMPAVARGAGQYLVVWYDRRLASAYVMGSRLAPDGSVLDPNGFIIAELSPGQFLNQFPTSGANIVWNGGSYMVVWTDQTEFSSRILRSVRVSPAGTVLGSPVTVGYLSSDIALRPAVAWSGVVHMATWRSQNFNGYHYVARLDAAGNLLDTPIDIGSSPGSMNPQIAWTGTEFLVTVGGGYRVVTAAGVVQGAAPVPLSGLVPQRLSCSGTSCAFTEHSGGVLRSVAFNAATKTIGAANTIVTSAALPASSIVWDGSRFLVVYGNNDLTAWTAGATPVVIENGADLANTPELASLGAGQSLLSYTLHDDAPGSLTRIYATIIDGAADAGIPCALPGDCDSGFCVEGVCCDTACGGDNPNDCQACTVAAGAAANGVCTPAAPTTLCRAANGICDAAEMCDGVNGTCPANGFLSGTVCRAATNLCDAVEVCNGLSNLCPANLVSPAGTVCRGSVGECDVAEICNGSSNACPADAAATPGSSCVGTPNACVTQACAGTVGATATCQATPRPAGFVCGASAGLCDVSETCDGAGSPCPSDVLQATGAVCRAAGGPCDVEEACDGASPACPVDTKLASGTECRTANGECDVAESCNGTANACPVDMGAAAGTPCGPAPTGECELESTCAGGTSTACEPNYEPAGTSCRAAEGPCDAEEACDGASADCPDDLPLDAGEVCAKGDPANDCDIDDVCDGIAIECPAAVAADGASCETAGDDGTCQSGECEPDGEGGSSGDGGSSADGGSAGEGGSATAGGNGAGEGGDSAGGGGASNNPTGDGGGPAPEEGCSCQTTRDRSPWGGAGGLSLMAALVVAGGRRARRRQAAPTTGTRPGRS